MRTFAQFRLSFLGLVALAAFATVLVLPGSALAAKTEHSNFDDTFADTVCDIDVTIHDVGVFNGFQYTTQSGYPLFKGAFHQTTTLTAANGKVVIITADAMFKDFRVVDNGDGTITVSTALNGQPAVYSLPDGTVLAQARGRLVFTTVFDSNGTPGDPDDDSFISSEIGFDAGSHPFAEGTLNGCDLIFAALS
jgi:hypothetical protein